MYRCPRCYLDIIEHMFYNAVIATRTCGNNIGGNRVSEKDDYKKMIVELVNKIDNQYWLRSIYVFIKTLLE